jgi:hypothetical protein
MRVEGGVFAAATAGADTTVELWCNDHCDLLHVGGEDVDGLLAVVRERVGVRDALVEADERLVITDDCLKANREDHVDAFLRRHDCLLLPPITYVEGAKVIRVLALDPENLTALYRDLLSEHRVTVEATREVDAVAQDRPLLTLDTALPDLSPRQHEALRTAVEAGYYEIPRATTTGELAQRLDVDRRTFEEHLRRAEKKLLPALVDHVLS